MKNSVLRRALELCTRALNTDATPVVYAREGTSIDDLEISGVLRTSHRMPRVRCDCWAIAIVGFVVMPWMNPQRYFDVVIKTARTQVGYVSGVPSEPESGR